jgi:hypothetical protein
MKKSSIWLIFTIVIVSVVSFIPFNIKAQTSSKITVSNTSASLGIPILRENTTIGYSFTLAFTVNNSKDEPIYIASMPSELVRLSTVNSPSAMNLSNMVVTPNTLSGDAEKVFVIPAGASRTVTVNGILRNETGTPGRKDVKVTGISYLNFGKNPDSGVVVEGLEGLRLTVVLDGYSNPTGKPTLNVLSPVGNRIYAFGSSIPVIWESTNVDADYYYALLENTAVKNLGVVITRNLPTASTESSFVFSKNIVDTIVANSGGLTEVQLKDGYYVRVIGIKKGILYNSAVIHAVSGVFSVSTIESSKGITVSGTKATLGSPVESKDEVIAYPISFTFTLNNQKNEDIYVPKVARNILALNADNKPSTVEFSEVFASSPAILAGDAEKVFVVPSGASRTFTIYGNINNNGGTSGLKDIRVTSISYINFGKNPDSGVVKEGLEKLRLNVLMIGTTENNKLVIRDASARLGAAIYRGNDAYGYNYEMSLIVSNPGKSDVYMSNKDDGADLNAVITPDVASVKYVKTWSPSTLAGDTSGAVIIPSGSSRAMKISGQLINMGKPTLVSYRITSLNYGTSSSNPRALSITSGLENLKVSATFGGAQATTTNPKINILRPKSREIWVIGNQYSIQFNSTVNDFEYYTISLKNKYSGTVGMQIAGNVTKSAGSYNFRLTDGLVKGVVANSPGKTAEQIKNDYYIEVLAMKPVYLNSTGAFAGYSFDVSGRSDYFTITSSIIPTPVPTNVPKSIYCPVGYICNPVNSSSSYCPTGYVCNSVTTNCPAGYTCTTKILKSSLATPVPTPYYSPSPTPHYYSTPIPTPVPTATATPAPTATPYITPSPTPSSAPATTSTPSPSSTPYSTPRPSTSPSPSSSPSAMNAEYDRLQASIWQAVAEWFMGR